MRIKNCMIENKQQILLNALVQYYKAPAKIAAFSDIISRKSNVSLRVIDYLCTNYARQHDVVYYIGKKSFNLHLQYQAQLKAYSKMQFDPFKRHQRIVIDVPKNIVSSGKLESTVAQLNFFKWALNNKVIDFLKDEKNMEAVEKHMAAHSAAKHKHEKKKVLKRHNVCVTVTFQ